MAYTALLDANVLYPAPVRDILLQLAVADVYRARWSAHIHSEWIEALLRNEPERDRAKLERTREMMDAATRDAIVTGYEHLIPALELPDPDDFLLGQRNLSPGVVCQCISKIRKRLTNPPYTVEQYLATLTRCGLVGTAAELQQFTTVL